MSSTNGTMDDHDLLASDLAAYALGGLSEAERVRMDERLRASADLRRQLADYQDVLALMPAALSTASPPPEARAWIMSRARASKAIAQPAKVSLWQRLAQQVQSLNPLRLAFAAVAVVAIAGLVLWNMQLQQQLQRMQQSALANGRVYALIGTGIEQASARLYVAPGWQQGELDVSNLPPLPPDRVYQLWFARPGQPTETGGAFRVDAQGKAVAQVTVPVPLDDVSAIAVTEEAAPGVQRPTTKHLLDAKP